MPDNKADTRKRTNSRDRGFTLVELLAVMALIGLLIALLLPAVGAAYRAALRRRARTDIAVLKTALEQYHGDFMHFPLVQRPDDHRYGTDYGAAIRVLRADAGLADLPLHNPRRILYLEVPGDRLAADGALLDPWNRPYRVAVDGDGNHALDGPPGTVRGTDVIIWSDGPRENDPADDIYSWRE